MPIWGKTEAPAEADPEAAEPEVPREVIPEALRPNVNGAGSAYGDEADSMLEFGEPVDDNEPVSDGRKETYVDSEGVERYVGSNRKKRSDSGAPRSRTATRGRKGKARVVTDAAATGGTIFYGGIGAVFSMSGIAPAAGLSMQGLADEAGPELAEWAKKRSPRFYKFLESIAEAGGVGKYVAAPVAAEAYLRMEKARPALGPAVIGLHGQESAAAFDALAAQYDSWKAEAMDGSVPPDKVSEVPSDPYTFQEDE